MFDPSGLSEEEKEEIGAFGLAAMAGIEEEPIDHQLYFLSIPEKRRIEFFAVLNPLHMQEVVSGKASSRVAGKLFRDGLQESRALYNKNYLEWETWMGEQERMAKLYFSTMKYELAREQKEEDAVLASTTVVELRVTTKHQELGPGPYDAEVPASPECYRPWMNWVAAEWMLCHKRGDGLRGEYAHNVWQLGARPKILRDDAAEEMRYRACALAEKLTSEENPNRTRYSVGRQHAGKYQIPKPLREDIELALPISVGSVPRYLKAASFFLPPKLNPPPLKR